ncbi:MAG: cache domain-containing protein [Pseudomonadota bacterium]
MDGGADNPAARRLSLRTRLALIAVLPILIVATIMAGVFAQQSRTLLSAETTTIRAEFATSKRAELRNYALMALASVRVLYENEPGGREWAKNRAARILHDLEYGEDGYFFVYDAKGTNIVHPRLPNLVGRNLIDLEDANGDLVIRNLIEKAQATPEGDFHTYVWPKPSTGEITEKLGYAIYLPNWEWMFGTGLYLDDVDAQIAVMGEQLNSNIRDTLAILLGVTAGVVLLAIGLLVAFSLSEQRMADARLHALTRRIVNVQEDERKRVSQELHDSISQLLIAVRYNLDAALGRSRETPGVSSLVQKSANTLDTAIAEVRRISKDLRPSVLDDIGLVSAIRALAEDFEASGLQMTVDADPQPPRSARLPEEARTALYRVTQEALSNVARHANATQVLITMRITERHVSLRISDNGDGFDVAARQAGVGGLGLRNMRERVELHNGLFLIRSATEGAGKLRQNRGASTIWTTEVMVRMPRQRAKPISDTAPIIPAEAAE